MGDDPLWLTRINSMDLGDEEKGIVLALAVTYPEVEQFLSSRTISPRTTTAFARALLEKHMTSDPPYTCVLC